MAAHADSSDKHMLKKEEDLLWWSCGTALLKPQHASNFSKSVIHICLLRNGQQLDQSYFDIKMIAVNVGLMVYFMWSKVTNELQQPLPSCLLSVVVKCQFPPLKDTTDFE